MPAVRLFLRIDWLGGQGRGEVPRHNLFEISVDAHHALRRAIRVNCRIKSPNSLSFEPLSKALFWPRPI